MNKQELTEEQENKIIEVIKKKVEEATPKELEESLKWLEENKYKLIRMNKQNHSQRKKDIDEPQNVSISGDTKLKQGQAVNSEEMSVDVDTHADTLK